MNIYTWGLSVIKSIQTIASPFLTEIMKIITFIGAPYFYLLILSLIFWCIDEKKGIKLLTLQVFGGAINATIKYTLAVPRPFVTDSTVGIIQHGGYSTPSGHAQGTASFWSYFAYLFNTMKLWQRFLLAFVIPLIVGFSRIYLGVHYPTDILLGWIIGYLSALAFMLFIDSLLSLIKPLRWSFKLLFITIICVIFNQLCPEDTSMPSLLFGLMLGWILLVDPSAPTNNKSFTTEHPKTTFSANKGNIKQKIIRWLFGLLIITVFYFLLRFLFPKQESNWFALFRTLRYMILGFITTYVCPKLFLKTKLA